MVLDKKVMIIYLFLTTINNLRPIKRRKARISPLSSRLPLYCHLD